MLRIYNSITKQKEIFTSIIPQKVSLYVCGMTVYDYCHIGHARTMIVFDIIVRYLHYLNYEVNYVRNITDIDDKIINRAHENNEPYSALTARFITALQEDAQALELLKPSQEPRATEQISSMVDMVQRLLDKKHAYIADNGDVYFDIKTFHDYGKLSHRSLSEMRAGERVEIISEKRDPLDFTLWKLTKPEDPSWDSPWGKGRPGWHLECSVMSIHCLANHIDIHGGGRDLLFPHHENEMAQSECATGEKFVNYWVHIGYLQINKEKMSKSLGNFFTIREVLQRYPGETIRYFMLMSHHRKPLNYTDESLQQAHLGLVRLYNSLRGAKDAEPLGETTYEKHFCEAMDDDFNTPEAVRILLALSNDINRQRMENSASVSELASLLRKLGGILGLLQKSPESFLQRDELKDIDKATIALLIEKRNKARQEKNWQEADAIRKQLLDFGIILEDTIHGTSWRRT